MVNAIYLILLAFAILYYLKKCLKLNNALVLLAFLMLYATHLLFVFGFGLYGEIPALFYLVVVLIFLHKHNDTAMPKFLFWAGVFLGLGYLTKTVILICVPALLFAVIFDFVVKRRLTLRNRPGLKRFFQEYVMLPAGFLVPVFVFELYKLISLGFPAYFRWWNDYFTTILNRAGVTYGYSEPNGVFARFLARLNLLSSFVGINKEIIIFLLVLVLFVFFAILTYGIYCFLKKQEPGKSQKILFSNDLLVLITVTLSYYGWWLLIVPENTVWERYILNGYILLEICLVLIVSLLAKYGKKLVLRTKQVPYILYGMIMFGYIGLLVVGSAFNIIQYGNYYISFRDTAEKIAYLQAGQMIRNLPTDAEIFGYDWWQAPVVEFTSGRTFDNLFTNVQMINPGPLNEKYFVVDSYTYELDPGGYQNILDQYDNSLVFSNAPEEIFIYKLNSRPLFAYQGFNDLEKKQVSYSKIDFTNNDLKVFVRNVYVDENNSGGKWAQVDSAYLIKYNGESKLKMDLWFQDLDYYYRTPVELQVYANRMPVYKYEVDQAGFQEIIVPLHNISGDTLEFTIICNSFFIPEDDGRQLAFNIGDMELVK